MRRHFVFVHLRCLGSITSGKLQNWVADTWTRLYFPVSALTIKCVTIASSGRISLWVPRSENTNLHRGETHPFHALFGDIRCGCCQKAFWNNWVSILWFFCEEDRQTRPLVFQVIRRRPPSEKWTHASWPAVPYCTWDGWRASCLQRERKEAGRAPRCCSSLGHQEEAIVWKNRICQKDPQTNPKTWSPLLSMWWPWSSTSWSKSSRYLRCMIFLHQYGMVAPKP